ncbi:MAG: septum formation protein Maf [Chitinophagaceae bacterium]|nr:septum formation protein Maf [Chitinophagaceae bacterium]
MKKIILASQSPRRRQLLEWAEIDFDIIVQSTDESYPAGLPPDEVAIYIAKQKAIAVKESEAYLRYESNLSVLAADTIVVCEGEILSKPKDRQDAVRILSLLSGKKHEVITGVVILSGEQNPVAFADTTEVWFHDLTREQIVFYIDNYKPYDKAGAYAIQEWIGVIGIKKINGDFYNVMGLPVSRVVRSLEM